MKGHQPLSGFRACHVIPLKPSELAYALTQGLVHLVIVSENKNNTTISSTPHYGRGLPFLSSAWKLILSYQFRLTVFPEISFVDYSRNTFIHHLSSQPTTLRNIWWEQACHINFLDTEHIAIVSISVEDRFGFALCDNIDTSLD